MREAGFDRVKKHMSHGPSIFKTQTGTAMDGWSTLPGARQAGLKKRKNIGFSTTWWGVKGGSLPIRIRKG